MSVPTRLLRRTTTYGGKQQVCYLDDPGFPDDTTCLVTLRSKDGARSGRARVTKVCDPYDVWLGARVVEIQLDKEEDVELSKALFEHWKKIESSNGAPPRWAGG